MTKIFDRLDDKNLKELKVLADFIHIFCRQKHRAIAKDAVLIEHERLRQSLGDKELVLCPDCRKLLYHGITKLVLCSYDPKPICRKCPTHCYAPEYRERIRQVMRFTGPYLIRRGRLDLIFHYLR